MAIDEPYYIVWLAVADAPVQPFSDWYIAFYDRGEDPHVGFGNIAKFAKKFKSYKECKEAIESLSEERQRSKFRPVAFRAYYETVRRAE